MSICVIGHVDHGKTTLVAALTQCAAAKYGLAKALTYNEVKRTKEEKERAVTIVVSTNQTLVRDAAGNIIEFIIKDCPGHKDYINNMISGAADVDYAVVAVAASKGWEAQTSAHVELVRALYVSKPTDRRILFFVITRIDEVEYDDFMIQLVAEDIQSKVAPYIAQGIFSEVVILQVSAGVITKVVEPAAPSVLEEQIENGVKVLEALISAPLPERPIDKPFLMEIEKCAQVTGVGSILVGSVKQGIVKPGDKVEMSLLTKNKSYILNVSSIQKFRTALAFGQAGDNIGICAKGEGIDQTDEINAGAYLAVPGTLKRYRGFIGKCMLTAPIGKNREAVMRSGAEQCIVLGAGVYTSTFIFLNGLSDAKKQEVRSLVLKGAKPNKSSTPDSTALQKILKDAAFPGAKFGEEVYDVLVVTHSENVRLPFMAGCSYVGQESRLNKTLTLVDEVF